MGNVSDSGNVIKVGRRLGRRDVAAAVVVIVMVPAMIGFSWRWTNQYVDSRRPFTIRWGMEAYGPFSFVDVYYNLSSFEECQLKCATHPGKTCNVLITKNQNRSVWFTTVLNYSRTQILILA